MDDNQSMSSSQLGSLARSKLLQKAWNTSGFDKISVRMVQYVNRCQLLEVLKYDYGESNKAYEKRSIHKSTMENHREGNTAEKTKYKQSTNNNYS